MTDVLVCVSIHLDVYVAVFGIYRESSHISGNFRLTSENLQIDGGVAILGQAEKWFVSESSVRSVIFAKRS